MNETETSRMRMPFRIPIGLGVILFLAIALFFLWEEHRAHLLGVLPYLIFLLCPLIHLLMHGGHNNKAGGHGQHGASTPAPEKEGQ